MIRDLDASLKAMLAGESKQGSELASATISFAAPDKDWRAQGTGLELDIYLYRAVDNRELRSNARRLLVNADGTITERQFPVRLECSYVISAWNKSAQISGLEREQQEHRLLSQVLYVLWRNPTMPSQYLVGSLADAEIALPIMAAESEDMAAKPDFWTSLDTPVRPSITSRITVAMDLDLDTVGPRLTTVQLNSAPDQANFTIGGSIRDASASGLTIPDAWIRLDGSPQTYFSDADGNFVIDRVTPGSHRLVIRAPGFQEGGRTFDVPEPSGTYDVVLTPI